MQGSLAFPVEAQRVRILHLGGHWVSAATIEFCLPSPKAATGSRVVTVSQ